MMKTFALASLLGACTTVYTDPGSHQPDAVPDAPPDTVPPDAAPVTTTVPKQVFVTSKTYQAGLLGGFDGADAICNTLAQAASRTGTFKAWLSDPTTAVRDRMVQSSGGYHLVDGTSVADSWAQLVSGTLSHAIDIDETGAVYTTTPQCPGQIVPVFTGTTYQGTWASDGTQACGGWTQLQTPDGLNGDVLVGDASAATSFWSQSVCEIGCASSAPIYCVEQ